MTCGTLDSPQAGTCFEKLRTRRKLPKPNESLFHVLPTICRLEIVRKKNEKQEELSRLIPLEGIRSCYPELPSSATFYLSCLRLLSQCCCLPTAYRSPATILLLRQVSRTCPATICTPTLQIGISDLLIGTYLPVP